jgi:hypothetical protein
MRALRSSLVQSKIGHFFTKSRKLVTKLVLSLFQTVVHLYDEWNPIKFSSHLLDLVLLESLGEQVQLVGEV